VVFGIKGVIQFHQQNYAQFYERTKLEYTSSLNGIAIQPEKISQVGVHKILATLAMNHVKLTG